MRFGLAPSLALFAIICTVVSVPALAADAPKDLEKRLDKVEGELRAVQRKVFPGGSARFFEPEYPTQPQGAPVAPATPGMAPETPLSQLQIRVDALEKQIADMTGQIEQNTNRVRKIEEEFAKFRGDVEYRLSEGKSGSVPAAGAAAAAPAVSTAAAPAAKPAATVAAAPAAAVSTPAAPAAKPTAPLAEEDEFRAAYAFIPQRDFATAEARLRAFIDKHPKGPRAPDALYWMGRAQFNQKLYGEAAKSFLAGYHQFPKSQRAPESLLSLGDSLVAIGNPPEACKAYNELLAVYPDASPDLKKRLAAARAKAKCD